MELQQIVDGLKMNYKFMVSMALLICDCVFFSLLLWIGNAPYDAFVGTLIFSGLVIIFGLLLVIVLLVVDFISRTMGGPSIVKDYWTLKRW